MKQKRIKKRTQKSCQDKKGLGMMDKVLIFVGALIIIFTVVMIVTFYRYGAIPDTLCTCVFTACTGEAGFMGIIQATKNKYQDREWQKEDREEMQDQFRQDDTGIDAGDNENETEE